MERAHILIVEHDPSVAKKIESALRGFGYDVSGIASSADTALSAVIASPPDLVLMDIKLHGRVDGIETADEVMHRYDIPVIFLSAFSDELTIQRAKETGPYGYLLQPFDPKELHATIEVALYKHGMEKTLKHNERRLRLITDTMPGMVSQTDAEGVFTYVSPSYTHVLGYDTGELIATRFLQYAHPDDVDHVKAKIEEACAHQGRSSFEFRCRHRNGRYLRLESDCTCIRSSTGEPAGAVFGVRDITARHDAQERTRSSRDRLAGIIQSAMDAIVTIDEG